jgi:hypothetical protein
MLPTLPVNVIGLPASVQWCYPSGSFVGYQGSQKVPLTVTRATTQTYLDGSGVLQTCPAGTLVVGPLGAEVYAAGTQLYPTPAAPAAGTVTVTATGAHIFWVVGAGSQAISLGTATGTGFPCTATAASPCNAISITATGTLTLAAVTGSLTRAQVETGTYATPFIAALGTRNATVASIPLANLHTTNTWCIGATLTPARSWAAVRSFPVNTGGATNFMQFDVYTDGRIYFGVGDGTGTVRQTNWLHGFASGSSHRLVGCNANGTVTLYADGASVQTVSTGGTGAWTATQAQLFIGSGGGGTFSLDGAISKVKIYPNQAYLAGM